MKRQTGLTMVEVLILFVMIGALVSQTLPFLQQSRESARAKLCARHLNQMGQAWLGHEFSQQHLPSSGWGWRWHGDPDLGFGRSQPGGWGYNMLPFLGRADVWSVGQGLGDDGFLPSAKKQQAMLVAAATPISQLNCPSRRPAVAYPVVRNGFLAYNLRACVSGNCAVTRSDYQANSGGLSAGESEGPRVSQVGNYDWPYEPDGNHTVLNGVSHQWSEITLAQITDGTSRTLMVGEKYLNPDRYFDGQDWADDGSAFMGMDRDVNGFMGSSSLTASRFQQIKNNPSLFNSGRDFLRPTRDTPGVQLAWDFGSIHANGWFAVFADGRTTLISYDADPFVLLAIAGRNDGCF